MDVLHGMSQGLLVCLTPAKLLACFFGVLVGTAVGVLPGIGSSGSIALLIPLTFYMDATSAVIMLAGIYYGTQYGGSTTSILVNVPGEAGSVITCLDGHQMARQGRAGAALGIAAFGSCIAGTIGVLGLMLMAPPLAEFALKFGPTETFALVFLTFTLVSYFSSGSMIKSLMMAALGLFLATVGQEAITAIPRFTFGSVNLQSGIDLVPLIMGLFGISEVLLSLRSKEQAGTLAKTPALRDLLPNRKEWRASLLPIGRGSLLGFLVGIFPGGSGITAAFASYALEKKLAKSPERFGKGAIEGLAGPESANNAAAQGCFIPMLSLGIPGNASMALTLGALKSHGIIPGPLLIQEHPAVFWGVVASMYLGNLMLLALNLPLIGLWVRLLSVATSILYPMIIFFCIVGAFSVNNNLFDVGALFVFGYMGYFLRRMQFDLTPLILGFILGPLLENTARQSLIMSGGQFGIFVATPISITLLGAAFLVLATAIYSGVRGGLKVMTA
ncbi:MAG: tripartite tricarboxylate transporter permease, partial [Candidatus Methylomirabilota bacterium]